MENVLKSLLSVFLPQTISHFSLCVVEQLCVYRFIPWSGVTRTTRLGNKAVETVVLG